MEVLGFLVLLSPICEHSTACDLYSRGIIYLEWADGGEAVGVATDGYMNCKVVEH